MKKIYARITMGLEVTDEEFKKIKKRVEEYIDIDDELAERFIKQGRLRKNGDSYIPEEWLYEFTDEWWD